MAFFTIIPGIILLLYFVYLFIRSFSNVARFHRCTVELEALVIEARRYEHFTSSNTSDFVSSPVVEKKCLPVVEYTYNGNKYTHKSSTSIFAFSAGDKAPVYINPQKPEVCFIKGEVMGFIRSMLAYLLIIIFFLIIVKFFIIGSGALAEILDF